MRLIDVPMGENDVNAKTVGDFLKELLLTLWKEAECFSGKRPFGNSDWQYQVYTSLIKAGYEIGKLDEYGDVDSLDYSKADELIADAITAVFAEPVKHGRWVRLGGDEHRCSVCGGYVDYESNTCRYNYCPYCGKMDGGAEND